MTGFWKWIGRQGRAFAAWRQREKIRKLFVKCWGVEGNFENPSTYGEKSQFRKLYGNHEFYGRLADKFLVRDYVRERVGEEVLVPLLGVHDRLDEKILDGLPQSFVIKVSNACKWNEIVFDKGKMDRRRTIRYFNRKLRKKYSRKFGEAHYDHSRPRIVIEELLSDEGQLPWNYDFFCYNGSKGFDFAICLTSPDGLHRGQYDRDGTSSRATSRRRWRLHAYDRQTGREWLISRGNFPGESTLSGWICTASATGFSSGR